MRDRTTKDQLGSQSETDQQSMDVQAAADEIFGRRVPVLVWVGVILALIVVFLVSFSLGRYHVTPSELLTTVYQHFFDPSGITDIRRDTAVFSIRFPRIIVVALVGAALAVAGASYQGMFKNPLVSPDLLGASAGASLGACLALLLNMQNLQVQLFAFGGGMIAVGFAVWLNRLVKYDQTLGLVLGGILVSTVFQSGTSLIKFVADSQDKLPTITFWLMGSFASVNTRDMLYSLPAMAIGFVVLLFHAWKLNVLSFGDEEATSLGIDTTLTRLAVIFAATLVTSAAVAVSGIVGWVGLVIPHLARAIVGPNYKVLLPTSMFIGATYLLIVDNIARLAAPVEIPIGILTSLLGVPFFIVIFKHNMGAR